MPVIGKAEPVEHEEVLVGIAAVSYEELLTWSIGMLVCEETVVSQWVIKLPPAEVCPLVFFLGLNLRRKILARFLLFLLQRILFRLLLD